jgi:hypothetical protein
MRSPKAVQRDAAKKAEQTLTGILTNPTATALRLYPKLLMAHLTPVQRAALLSDRVAPRQAHAKPAVSRMVASPEATVQARREAERNIRHLNEIGPGSLLVDALSQVAAEVIADDLRELVDDVEMGFMDLAGIGYNSGPDTQSTH